MQVDIVEILLFTALILIVVWILMYAFRKEPIPPPDGNGNGSGADESEIDDDSAVPADKRNRVTRFLWASFVIFLSFFFPIATMILVFGKMTGMFNLAMYIGFIIGSWIFIWVFPKVTVSTPLLQAVVTENFFAKGRKAGKANRAAIIYGSGVHARLSWERLHHQNHVSLRDVTKVITETISTLTSQIILTFQYRWKPDLPRLDIYFGRGISTINEALSGHIKDFFSSIFAHLSAEQVRAGHRVINAYADFLFEEEEADVDRRRFTAEENKIADIVVAVMPEKDGRLIKTIRSLEGNYGINMLNVEMIDADFPKEVQETMNTLSEIKNIKLGILDLVGIDAKTEDVNKIYRDAVPPELLTKLLSQVAILSNQAKESRVTDERSTFDINLGGDIKALIEAQPETAQLFNSAIVALTNWKKGQGGSGKGKGKGAGNKPKKKGP